MFTQYFAEYITAGNPSTPMDTLERLAHFHDELVRRRVSESRRCSAALLVELAADSSSEVRIAVAHNPNTPLAVLGKLLRDSNPDVRYSLATNHRLPLEFLMALQQDQNPYVARRANRTLARLNTKSIS